MANYLNAGSVNLTGTFSQAEGGAGAITTTKTSATNSGTGVQFSNTFTGTNGHVCDGVLLSCKRVNTNGTVTITLTNGTLSASVTVNASDLPTNPSWVFFKFTSTVTFDGTANWKIGMNSSVSGNSQFNYDTTTLNWSRIPRITLTGTPGAADVVWIVTELTGAGTSNVYTVTMNQTSNATVYGDINICYMATLSYGITASTAYYLKMAGTMWLWDTATLNIGTQGSPIPASSSAILEFACTSNVQYGLELQFNATLNTYGNALTFTNSKLSADVAANATTITTVDNTGWVIGDQLALASTTRTNTDCESFSVSAISSTTITVTGGGGTAGAVKNAHSGTVYNNTTWNADTRAEIINLTRNVKIRGISTTFQAYLNLSGTTATVNCNWTEFYQLGSATTSKRGIDIGSTTAPSACTFSGCSFHDYAIASSIGLNFNTSSVNVTVTNNVFYNITNTGISITGIGASATTFNVSNNVILLITAGGSGINCTPVASPLVLSNNTVVGVLGTGITIGTAAVNTATISNLVTHACSTGMSLVSFDEGSVTNLTSWRNTVNGITCSNIGGNLVLDGITLYGNTTTGINFSTSDGLGTTFNNVTSNNKAFTADTFTQTNGMVLGVACLVVVNFTNSNFGMTFPHLTADINNSVLTDTLLLFYNTKFGTTPIVTQQTNLTTTSRIGSQRHQGVAGSHMSWFKYGQVNIDAVIYDVSATDTDSERLTPNGGAGNKLRSGPFRVAIASGQTATISLKVRQSVVGDGAAYNGALPRVISLKNIAVGVNNETVLATATVAGQGAWETLTFTTPSVNDDAVLSFCVDCDGNAGWVNVDTISVS
jgi:hypothetical protein